jgi:hypothetical protein
MGYTHKTNPLLRARFQHMPFSKIKTPNTCNVAIFCVFDCNDSVRNEGGGDYVMLAYRLKQKDISLVQMGGGFLG